MTKAEVGRFIQNLPYLAPQINDLLWNGPDLVALADQLDKLAQDAAAASETIKSLYIYKPAA